MKPGPLVNPSHMLVPETLGRHDRPQLIAHGGGQRQLIVPGPVPAGIGQHPYLQELHRLGVAGVEFAVRDSRTGRHHLYPARPQFLHIPHTVTVSQRPGKRNRNDLHIGVRVGSEPLAGCHGIVVQHPKRPEMDPLRIVIVRKTERMIGIEPTVVGMAARRRTVQYFVHLFLLSIFGHDAKTGPDFHPSLRRQPVAEAGKIRPATYSTATRYNPAELHSGSCRSNRHSGPQQPARPEFSPDRFGGCRFSS